MKSFIYLIFLLFTPLIINAQQYTASGWTGFSTTVNGVYNNTGMQSDGVDYYAHASNSVFIFRVDLSGSKSWLIASSPDLFATIVYDVISSSSNTPPTTGWNLGSLSFGNLPVELIDFKITIEKGSPYLSWSTASEYNNQGFEVQRSPDGINFEAIAFVKGKGNTDQIQSYSYFDETVVGNKLYYKLKQIDFDGSYEYSDLQFIALSSLNNNSFQLFPNPAGDWIRIQGREESQALIFDQRGGIVKTLPLAIGNNLLSIQDLEKGLYILVFYKNNRKLSSLPFVKH